jgi:thiamine biosynthesis lipoprotein
MQTEQFRAMNTGIVMLAEGAENKLRAGFAAAHSFIEDSEQRFTRFSEESELSQLNRGAGKWFKASEDLFIVIREALQLYKQTHGLFDPSILPQLQMAGYTQSMDEIRKAGSRVPEQADPQRPAGLHRFEDIDLDPDTYSIRLPEGMQIDLGGIAKGWIAERAAELLYQHADACAVDAGGDMCLRGYPEGQSHWEVAVEDPRDNDLDLLTLRALEGAVATSSVAKRTWQQGKRRRHHLIDPRTGEPANSQWLSVTVMAPHATQAEVFAKAFLMAGSEEAQVLRMENPGITVLAVDTNGAVIELSKKQEQEDVFI